MTQFENTVEATVQKYNMLTPGDTVIAGVSGGADSVAMLYTLWKMSQKYNLRLVCVHLNHGIRGDEARRDERFVCSLSHKLGIKCICEYKDIPTIAKNNGLSEELAGRNERYSLFEAVAKAEDGTKIAVAHNKNDCAETVLMKLARGATLNGLRGIAPVNGKIIRPLIECDRASIEAYLANIGQEYMTDSTNADTKYTRNLVRNEIIPLMQRINPGFVNTVYNNSKSIADDDDFIEQCANNVYDRCVSCRNGIAKIDLNCFEPLHISLKKRIILYAVSCVKGDKRDIEQKHIDILTSKLATGKSFDIGAGLTAYTEYDTLCIAKETSAAENYEFDIIPGNRYSLCDRCIFFEITDNNDMSDKSCMYINADDIDGKRIVLRNRRDGDRFAPSGMNGTKKLKSFFIDNKISQAERAITPLLCIDGEIAAVLGHRVSSRFVVTDKTKKILKVYINGGTNE